MSKKTLDELTVNDPVCGTCALAHSVKIEADSDYAYQKCALCGTMALGRKRPGVPEPLRVKVGL